MESLEDLPNGAPGIKFTVEIHEGAIVNVASLVELKAALRDRGIRIAYDDFGAGQARLLELGEAPPDLLKFDIRFIRGMDDAPPSKRRLLKSLVQIARDLGAEAVAEGVERPRKPRPAPTSGSPTPRATTSRTAGDPGPGGVRPRLSRG